MGKIRHPRRVLKAHPFQLCQRRFHAASHRAGGLRRQNADDLPGKGGGGVGRSGVKAAGVCHLHLSRLRRRVQRDVGGVVAIRGQQPQGRVPFRRAQLTAQRRGGVGQIPHRQNLHRDHAPASRCSPTPETFFVRIVSISPAMCAPASTAGVPWAWMLDTTVRADSETPVLGR